jgi:hypothetical protein
MTTCSRAQLFPQFVATDRDRTLLFVDSNQDVPHGAHR